MQRLRDIMLEYKFVVNWEEEQMISKGRGANPISAESAYANLMLLMSSANEDSDQEMGDGEAAVKKGGKSTIDRPNQLICGGMQKPEVF